MEPWAAVIIGLFGGGGLVSLIKAWMDYRAGASTKRDTNSEREIQRLHERVKALENAQVEDRRYEIQLINALAAAGGTIPTRRRN